MIVGFLGLQSAGKSQLIAVRNRDELLTANKALKERRDLGLPDVFRTFATDSPFSESFIQEIEASGHKYLFFRDLNQVLGLTSCILSINEITKFFPANGSRPLTPEQVEFLSQAAKQGNDLIFAAQDYSQTHKQFRIHVNEIYLVSKQFGNPRPAPWRPPVNKIWGLATIWPIQMEGTKADLASLEVEGVFPTLYWYNKEDVSLFDTSYKVAGTRKMTKYKVEQPIEYVDSEGKVVKKVLQWVDR